jgi:hypothetical protein
MAFMVSMDANGRTYRDRRNQPAVEIQPDALPDSAMSGLLEDWIVPFIADRVIQTMVQERDYYEHNNHTDIAHDLGTQVEDRKATRSGSVEADAPATNIADEVGTQSPQRLCSTVVDDDE